MIDMEVIKKQVRPIELARMLGIPPTTVYSWKKIPSWREDAVVNALNKNGIKIKQKNVKVE